MSAVVIGLTGGIGSGKTTITNIFQTLGVDIIDADIIAREVVAVGSPALAAITKHFGSDYIQADGQLNRALLRERIFTNKADKDWLNTLLHPLIRSTIITQTESALSPYCILVAPLLIENNLHKLVNSVLVIDVSENTQIQRTTLRDSISLEVVKSIMSSQISRTERLKHADDIISNEVSVSHDRLAFDALQKQVFSLDKKYLALTA